MYLPPARNVPLIRSSVVNIGWVFKVYTNSGNLVAASDLPLFEDQLVLLLFQDVQHRPFKTCDRVLHLILPQGDTLRQSKNTTQQ